MPLWKETPAGQTFFYSRRRHARLGVCLIATVQSFVLFYGIQFVAPGLIERVAGTTLQAPSLLRLAIEAGVFFIALGLEIAGVLLLLLMPTWIGCIFFMAKRSREGYFVDITPTGVSVETPVDRFFIAKEAITRIKTAPLFPVVPSICIYAGRRRIVLRRLIPFDQIPEQKRLWHWIRGNAPGRTEIREGMVLLKQKLENMVQ